MFNCQKCRRTQPHGTKINKITIETRPVAYTRTIRDRDSGGETVIEVGHGHEIVREMTVCEKCKAVHEKEDALIDRIIDEAIAA